MSLGLSLFLSSIFLGIVALFIATKDRWNWKKIILWPVVGTFVLALLSSASIYLYWRSAERRPVPPQIFSVKDMVELFIAARSPVPPDNQLRERKGLTPEEFEQYKRSITNGATSDSAKDSKNLPALNPEYEQLKVAADAAFQRNNWAQAAGAYERAASYLISEGHASVATTEKHYAQFSPQHSARKILKVLEGGKRSQGGNKTDTSVTMTLLANR